MIVLNLVKNETIEMATLQIAIFLNWLSYKLYHGGVSYIHDYSNY